MMKFDVSESPALLDLLKDLVDDFKSAVDVEDKENAKNFGLVLDECERILASRKV